MMIHWWLIRIIKGRVTLAGTCFENLEKGYKSTNGSTQQTFTCSMSTIGALEKGEMRSKLTIKAPQRQ